MDDDDEAPPYDDVDAGGQTFPGRSPDGCCAWLFFIAMVVAALLTIASRY